MKEKVCKSCGHSKREHSRQKCFHQMSYGLECPCDVKGNQNDMFEDGTPLKD